MRRAKGVHIVKQIRRFCAAVLPRRRASFLDILTLGGSFAPQARLIFGHFDVAWQFCVAGAPHFWTFLRKFPDKSFLVETLAELEN